MPIYEWMADKKLSTNASPFSERTHESTSILFATFNRIMAFALLHLVEYSQTYCHCGIAW
jgi:hypothetical protein